MISFFFEGKGNKTALLISIERNFTSFDFSNSNAFLISLVSFSWGKTKKEKMHEKQKKHELGHEKAKNMARKNHANCMIHEK